MFVFKMWKWRNEKNLWYTLGLANDFFSCFFLVSRAGAGAPVRNWKSNNSAIASTSGGPWESTGTCQPAPSQPPVHPMSGITPVRSKVPVGRVREPGGGWCLQNWHFRKRRRHRNVWICHRHQSSRQTHPRDTLYVYFRTTVCNTEGRRCWFRFSLKFEVLHVRYRAVPDYDS